MTGQQLLELLLNLTPEQRELPTIALVECGYVIDSIDYLHVSAKGNKIILTNQDSIDRLAEL